MWLKIQYRVEWYMKDADEPVYALWFGKIEYAMNSIETVGKYGLRTTTQGATFYPERAEIEEIQENIEPDVRDIQIDSDA